MERPVGTLVGALLAALCAHAAAFQGPISLRRAAAVPESMHMVLGEGFALSALPYRESLSGCQRLSLRPRCRCASVGSIQRSFRHLQQIRMTAAESLEVMSLPAEPSPKLSVG